jgi:hypothetical protein
VFESFTQRAYGKKCVGFENAGAQRTTEPHVALDVVEEIRTYDGQRNLGRLRFGTPG